MVFLIQNTQNRDAMAVQLKLDELIIAVKEARNETVEIENLDEAALEDKRNEMIDLAEHAEQDVSEMKEIAKEEKASGEDEA